MFVSALTLLLALSSTHAAYVQNGLTLNLNDKSNGQVPNSTIQTQINAFFQLYPQTVQNQIRFGTPTTLTLTLDPTLASNAVAASSNQLVLSVSKLQSDPSNTQPLQAAINQSLSGFGYGRNGVYVTVQNLNSGVASNTIQNLITTFFTNYPKEVAYFKPQTPVTNLTFIFDPNYNGAAVTEASFAVGPNNVYTTVACDIRFAAAWYIANPKDVDSLTHEAMHVTQYGGIVGCKLSILVSGESGAVLMSVNMRYLFSPFLLTGSVLIFKNCLCSL